MSLNIAKSDKKRVVIVGGGFGGLKLANKLKKSGFQVVLIDKNNYHQFPPLIY
ncbi:FAD-dependent oxidoreductase, partial [Bacteroides acidifaciens]